MKNTFLTILDFCFIAFGVFIINRLVYIDISTTYLIWLSMFGATFAIIVNHIIKNKFLIKKI